jgi:hypothetical protein
MSAEEYEFEEIPGLPGPLPQGEKLLWQGSPRPWALARRSLFVVPVGAYFLLVALWQGVSIWQLQPGWQPLLHSVGRLLLLGAIAVGLLCMLGWASARATVYSLTTKRVVIRHGIALPIGVNLPLPQIEAVAIARHWDGTAELALSLPKSKRLSYVVNWPYVRTWHLTRPQPTLRAVTDADRLVKLLTQALSVAGGAPAAAPVSAHTSEVPARAPQSALPVSANTQAA